MSDSIPRLETETVGTVRFGISPFANASRIAGKALSDLFQGGLDLVQVAGMD